MKGRGAGTLVGLVITVVASVAGLHSCAASPPGSATNPATVVGNAVNGLCANQDAEAAAGGQAAAPGLDTSGLTPSQRDTLNAVSRAAGGPTPAQACTTTTTGPADAGR